MRRRSSRCRRNSAASTPTSGASSAEARGSSAATRCRPRLHSRTRSARTCSDGASSSSARPSATPICRRWAWLTTTRRAASGKSDDQGAARSLHRRRHRRDHYDHGARDEGAPWRRHDGPTPAAADLPHLRAELRVRGDLLEQPPSHVPCCSPRYRRYALGEPASAFLAVAGSVRHRLDEREPLCAGHGRGLRRSAAFLGAFLHDSGARALASPRARLRIRQGRGRRPEGQPVPRGVRGGCPARLRQHLDIAGAVHRRRAGMASARPALRAPAPGAQAMIVVHHLNNSRSQRVLWLLEELGLPYEIKRYQRDAKTMLAPPALREVHPLGKSPVITDGDVTMAESGAIIEYLVERYGKGSLAPSTGSPERRRYLYWMHFAEGSAMPPLVMKLVLERMASGPMPFFARPIARAIAAKVKGGFVEPNIARQLDFMEAELGKSVWFAGAEFTAADIQMSFPLEAAVARAGLDATRPRLMDFLARIHAREAYRRALERGGEFKLLT